ncbi:MAG TPA: UbiH/UbiF/VisC/COQ6 family ubiquinone biosynthesis hydroxylase, partial [Burkholderiales bacterium]|nr:UbiH/UbiF/VisC/COQ6 family ubiquinone biosynthesis hydroxylase [Burkholderiales bacterium]
VNFDVLIVGGGMVGASFACALGDSRLKVGIIDARAPVSLPHEGLDARVSAITLASRNFLQNLDVWNRIPPMRVTPVEAMQIWETQGEVRFDAADIGEPCLAYVVENAAIQQALVGRLQGLTNIHALWPVRVEAIEFDDACAAVTLNDGRRLAARLLVGADGADSAVRRLAGIDARSIDMAQKGIVAVVQTERAHGCIARQRFLPTGPLAFLPLAEPNACSIVWSADTVRADALMGLSDSAFIGELQTALGDALGRILVCGPRQAFALALVQARRYTASRLALIGDAAHTVHPLAGQGVNLGFLDAAALAGNVLASARQGRDAGAHRGLRRYERARKGDNLGMIAVTGGFKYLFGNELPLLRGLRNIGLNLTDVVTPAKRFFMRRAAGITGDLPVLARRFDRRNSRAN